MAIALGFCASFFSRELGGNPSQRRWAGFAIVAPYAAVWCVMGLLVTPVQMILWSAYRRPGTISGTAVSLLWVLLWDVILPSVGVALGGTISARAFSNISASKPSRQIA